MQLSLLEFEPGIKAFFLFGRELFFEFAVRTTHLQVIAAAGVEWDV